MSGEHWTERLSEYLDGDLGGAEGAACEAHLRACPECAGVLADLRRIRTEAGLLPDLEPSADLWPAIRERLTPRGAPVTAPAEAPATGAIRPLRARWAARRLSFTVPQLAAAAIALVLMSSGGVYLGLARESAASPGAVAAAPPPSGAATLVFHDADYEAVVSELEAEFLSRRPELDPETVRVVELNLAIIERAMADARAALAADPSSGFLNAHLVDTRRQKVELLRQATRIDQSRI